MNSLWYVIILKFPLVWPLDLGDKNCATTCKAILAGNLLRHLVLAVAAVGRRQRIQQPSADTLRWSTPSRNSLQ